MYRINIALLSGVLLFIAPALYAAGVGSIMGGLSTVVPDGPFDASRNPALLPLLIKEHSIGYDAISPVHRSYDASGNLAANITGITIGDTVLSIEDFDIIAVKGALSYASKVGNVGTFGVAIKPQLTTQTPTGEFSITVTNPFSGKLSSQQKIEQIETNNEIYLAYGIRFAQNVTAGIQLSAQKKYECERNLSSTYQNGSFNAGGGKIDESWQYTGMASMGLLYHADWIQTGIILSSGRYGWHRHALSENESNQSDPSESFNVSDSTSFHGRYCEGPSALVGIYAKITPTFAFAVEGGYQIPLEYTNNAISRVENSIEEIDEDIEIKNVYVVGGGISYTISNSLTFAAGLHYVNFHRNSTQANSKEKMNRNFELQQYTITAGVDLLLIDTIHAILFASSDIQNIAMEFSTTSSNSSLTMNLDITNVLYSVGIGIVHHF
ncbi:MAG: hypothetical protein N2316_07065 [Spirochaetes bacterium]|nr:hypothetical protein [Spirochaetota bacterium]